MHIHPDETYERHETFFHILYEFVLLPVAAVQIMITNWENDEAAQNHKNLNTMENEFNKDSTKN